MRKCVEWNKKRRKNLQKLNCTFKYSGVAGSARVEPGAHVNYRCWCRWMWWLSSLSLLYTPLLSRAVAVLLRAFWVHGCALVHSFIIRYQITIWKKWKNDNKCSLKLDLDPIQWETRSTGGCRWLSPSYPSVIIRLARPNDTRNHCRPLVCCSAAVLARTSWFMRQMVAASAVTSGHAALQHWGWGGGGYPGAGQSLNTMSTLQPAISSHLTIFLHYPPAHFLKSVTQCCPPCDRIVLSACHWLTHSFKILACI